MTDLEEYRKKKLNDAVAEYVTLMKEAGGLKKDHFVTGWVIGIAITGFDENGEVDGSFIESSHGINNFFASGLAATTSEKFASQALGCTCEDCGLD